MSEADELAARLAQVAVLRDEAALLAAARDSRWQVRRAALRRLEDYGLATPELLVEALADRAGGVRRYAALTLRSFGRAALAALEAGLNRAEVANHCSGLLATSQAGRELLAAKPDCGQALLLPALRETDLSIRDLIAVTKAIVICPGAEVGNALADLLDHRSVMLRAAAGRALWARWDPRALPWVVERLETSWMPESVMIDWLGEQGDPRALPCLRRLASIWQRPLSATREHRRLAKAAIARIEEGLRHVPDSAISRAAPPSAGPAAISLWREGELPDEAEAE